MPARQGALLGLVDARVSGRGGWLARRQRGGWETAGRPLRLLSSPACGGGREGAGGRAARRGPSRRRVPPPAPPASGRGDAGTAAEGERGCWHWRQLTRGMGDSGAAASIALLPRLRGRPGGGRRLRAARRGPSRRHARRQDRKTEKPPPKRLPRLRRLGLRPPRRVDRILRKNPARRHAPRPLPIPRHTTRIPHQTRCVNPVARKPGGGITARLSQAGGRGRCETSAKVGPASGALQARLLFLSCSPY